MKDLLKSISVLLLLVMAACVNEEFPILKNEIPNSLKINNEVGLSVESQFVQGNIKMNVKVSTADTYTVRLHHISGRTVVKDEIRAEVGDNIKILYTAFIPKEPYTLVLYDKQGVELAKTVINLL
jgi:hypothetical protein